MIFWYQMFPMLLQWSCFLTYFRDPNETGWFFSNHILLNIMPFLPDLHLYAHQLHSQRSLYCIDPVLNICSSISLKHICQITNYYFHSFFLVELSIQFITDIIIIAWKSVYLILFDCIVWYQAIFLHDTPDSSFTDSMSSFCQFYLDLSSTIVISALWILPLSDQQYLNHHLFSLNFYYWDDSKEMI